MVANSKLHSENEYFLDYVTLTNYKGNSLDIKKLTARLTVELSLFAPIHVTVILEDSLDLLNLFPIIGKESLSFSFTRYSDTGDSLLEPIVMKDLPIYMIGDKTQTNNKRQVYRLYFTTKESYNNLKTPVYKAYYNSTYSDMIKNVYDEYLKTNKEIEVEPTKNFRNYVIQNKTPFAVIADIRNKCISSETDKGNNYVFFEDLKQYNFKSYAYLFKQEPIYTIRNEVKNTSDITTTDKDIVRDIANIEEPYTGKDFNNFKSIEDLKNGCTILSIDHITRTITKTEYSVKDNYDDMAHLGKYKSFDDTSSTIEDIYDIAKSGNIVSLTSNIGIEENEYVMSHDKEMLDTHIEENLWTNLSSNKQYKERVLKATVSGNPILDVGKIIDVIIPEKAGDVSSNKPEQLSKLSQSYLISAIAHIIEPKKYICALELMADANSLPIEEVDIIERYKNIVTA